MCSSRKPVSSAFLQLSRAGLEGGPVAPDHPLESPHSPLYVDPYTPPATSHHKITDVQDLDEVSHEGDRRGWRCPKPGLVQATMRGCGALERGSPSSMEALAQGLGHHHFPHSSSV